MKFWTSRWFKIPCNELLFHGVDAVLPEKLIIAPLNAERGAVLRVSIYSAAAETYLQCNGSVFADGREVFFSDPEGKALPGQSVYLKIERDPEAPDSLVLSGDRQLGGALLPEKLVVSVFQVSLKLMNWGGTLPSARSVRR